VGLTLADLFAGTGTRAQPQPAPDDIEPLSSTAELEAAMHALLDDHETFLGLRSERGWSPLTIARYGLGLAADGSIVFPVRSATGELLTVERYRTPSIRGDGPKMVAARGRQRQLLLPPGAVPENVYITEGYSDAVAATSAGLATVGAPSAHWSESFTASLRDLGVGSTVIVFDCDDAGRKGAAAASASLERAGIHARVIDLDPSRTDGHDVTDVFLEHDHERGREILEQLTAAAGPPARTDWPPLALGVGELPVFPAEVLPSAVRDLVVAVSEHAQTPLDLAAFMVLAVLSAAALGSYVVDCVGWVEELALYLLLFMASGERKSTVQRAVVKPLRLVERQRQEVAAPILAKALARRAALEAQSRELVKRMGGDDETAEEEFAAVSEELAELGSPELPRMFVDDATPEAVVSLLARHDSMAVIASESAFLDNAVFGRYADGGPNLHVICGAYSGEETTVDRKTHEPLHLARPLLTMAFAVQQHILPKLLSSEIARSQGLVGRCAFALPQTRLGQRRVDAPPVAPDVAQRWNEVVHRIAGGGGSICGQRQHCRRVAGTPTGIGPYRARPSDRSAPRARTAPRAYGRPPFDRRLGKPSSRPCRSNRWLAAPLRASGGRADQRAHDGSGAHDWRIPARARHCRSRGAR
jgi:hypothetical protein